VVVNYEKPVSNYNMSVTADDCGQFDDVTMMLLGSGKKWKSDCRKMVAHTLLIKPEVQCRGGDWTVTYVTFKLDGIRKVEVYVDEQKLFSVSRSVAISTALEISSI